MPETPDLPAALREGEQALAAFTAAQPPSEAQALAVLLARDAIRAALAAEPAPDADSLLALQAFDRQVCAQQAALLRAIAQLETWRNLLQPPAEAWWWQPPRSRWTRYDVAANAATGVFLTASLSLLAETSSRFLAADSGLIGSSAIVVQTVLTLAAGGGALTKAGRTVVEQTYNSLRVPKLLRQEASAALALLVLLALMSIHALLPRFAELFNRRGYANFQAQQFESAIANYQTAIALKPDYARAHYRLALVYDELQQFDAARDAYQLALQADAPALDATAQLKVRHNLGRLEIAAGNYEAAIAPLLAGLELLETAPVARELAAATQRDFRYQLQTNLGWAQEGLGNLDVAASLLAEAIALYPERATAHCLAGKVTEAQGQRAAALAAWNNCRTYADRRDPEQYRWWSLARQRLSELAAGS